MPEALLRVVGAKRLLETERATTVQEATGKVGISRSPLYKYEDDIFPFYDSIKGKTVTLVAQMDDEQELLSGLLYVATVHRANILTIHQSISINDMATLTLSVEARENTGNVSGVIEELEVLDGIHYVRIPARGWRPTRAFQYRRRIEHRERRIMIKITVMGYNTIGSGVARILGKNRDAIANQVGQEVELKHVPGLRELPSSPVVDKIIHDFKVTEQDEEVKVAVETAGGLNPAYSFAKACLMVGKNVVTPNKALVVARGTELLVIARKKHVNFSFEASVGGSTPIIRPLYRCLMGEHVEKITDILSGTTNFILTKMDKERGSLEDALKEAQNLGYVERNPEADAEGHDTRRRIVILTAVATGEKVNYEDTYAEGTTRVTDINLKYAEKIGTSIKLLGTSRIKDGRVLAYVASVMINKTSPLYSINSVLNGILMKGNMLDTSIFYGSGAGKFLTGSVVMADIIETVQNLKKNVLMGWTDEKQTIKSMGQAQFRYLVKAAGFYRNKEQDVENAFGQVEVTELCGMDEFALPIAQMAEGEFRKAAASYDSREQKRPEYDIKQMIRAVLQHMALVINRIIDEIARQGFPCLLHLLTGLYCLGYGGARALRALLAGNLFLSIRYYPPVAYMVVVLTAELASFAMSRAAKNPRYYLGYEKLLVYAGAVIALVGWVCKNYMLMVRGVGLLLLWSC